MAKKKEELKSVAQAWLEDGKIPEGVKVNNQGTVSVGMPQQFHDLLETFKKATPDQILKANKGLATVQIAGGKYLADRGLEESAGLMAMNGMLNSAIAVALHEGDKVLAAAFVLLMVNVQQQNDPRSMLYPTRVYLENGMAAIQVAHSGNPPPENEDRDGESFAAPEATGPTLH